MNKRRLMKLATHLLKGKLGHEVFDFGKLNYGKGSEIGCGTNGCAIGECPIVWPDKWGFLSCGWDGLEPRLRELGKDLSTSVKTWFDLTEDQMDYLFYPGFSNLKRDATKEQVANQIIEFVETNGESFENYEKKLEW